MSDSQRIAVIGSGGAGMTAAWLLDGQHEVTVFERSAKLGGHAHTTVVERDGRTHYADDGFGWFSADLYPTFMRYLKALSVPTRPVAMSLSFTQAATGRILILPPDGLRDIGELLATPKNVLDLLELNRFMGAAAPMVAAKDHTVTMRDFLADQRLSEGFCRDVLLPLIGGSWGCPADRILDCSAYTLAKYFVLARPTLFRSHPWMVIKDGAASYIDVVEEALQTATIRPRAKVVAVRREEGVWRVHEAQGEVHEFDHVIVATGARDAVKLVRDEPCAQAVVKALDGFEYYSVRVATHSDPSFLPADRRHWRVANLHANGERAALTVWTDAEGGSDVFTTYLLGRVPEECHNISTFHLPLITPAHYRAQQEVSSLQGRDNLWFAGDWSCDFGSHEEAVVSALTVCGTIDPSLPRLRVLRGDG